MGAKPASTRLFVLVSVVVASVACNPVAVVHYSQLGACKRAVTPTGEQLAPPNYAYVIFRVTSIDNSKIASAWTFDSNKLVINPPSLPQSNLGGLGPVTVPANAVLPVNVLVGIQVQTGNLDGSDAAKTNYFLLYDNQPPGTLGAKANHSQISYPFVQQCMELVR